MNTTSKHILTTVTLSLLAVFMVLALATTTSFAAKKKVYKIPYKVTCKNAGGGYVQTFNIKNGKLTSVKYTGSSSGTVKLTYKSSSKILLKFTDIDLENTLTVKKNKVVKRTGNNNVCTYKYNKKGKLIKAVIDNSSDRGVNIFTMTFTRSKKGDITKKVEHLVDKPVDETIEPTDMSVKYTYKNTYKRKLLNKQTISYTFEGETNTSTKTFKYKKLKLTKTQYNKYMNMWDLFNEVI